MYEQNFKSVTSHAMFPLILFRRARIGLPREQQFVISAKENYCT